MEEKKERKKEGKGGAKMMDRISWLRDIASALYALNDIYGIHHNDVKPGGKMKEREKEGETKGGTNRAKRVVPK